MNKKKRSIVILIIITLLIYNIIPIINDIFPNSVYYTFLTDLWIINSLYALISSIVMSKKYGFNIYNFTNFNFICSNNVNIL